MKKLISILTLLFFFGLAPAQIGFSKHQIKEKMDRGKYKRFEQIEVVEKEITTLAYVKGEFGWVFFLSPSGNCYAFLRFYPDKRRQHRRIQKKLSRNAIPISEDLSDWIIPIKLPDGSTMALLIEYRIVNNVLTLFDIPYDFVKNKYKIEPEIEEQIQKELDLTKLH